MPDAHRTRPTWTVVWRLLKRRLEHPEPIDLIDLIPNTVATAEAIVDDLYAEIEDLNSAIDEMSEAIFAVEDAWNVSDGEGHAEATDTLLWIAAKLRTEPNVDSKDGAS